MNILIIAGGTGGHVYPALSIANEFQDDGNTIFWIGKKNSLEENIAISEDFSFHSINARGFLGKNFFAKIGSIFFVLKNIFYTNSIFFYNWHSNAFLVILIAMEIIINSPSFYLHIQDAVIFIQYCIDGIINIASQFKI